MKNDEIIKSLINQNQMLLDGIFGLVKVIPEQNNRLLGLLGYLVSRDKDKDQECNNHKESRDLLKNVLNEDGVFDPFKGMDEEMKKGFTNALKHAPDIISVLKKEQDKEEERNREWKEKMGKI